MFTVWSYALLILALIAMALTYRVPRAWRYIGIGTASYVVSSLYIDFFGTHLHPLLTFTCDAAVCAFIYRTCVEEWEIGVFLAFVVSVFSSLLMIGGFIGEYWVYSSLLEFCSAAALLWISFIGVVELLGRHGHSYFRDVRRRLHSNRHSL